MSLSKKIAVSFYNGRPDPYKKTEFPSLQEICQKVIEQNFHIYPELDGIDPFFKEQIYNEISLEHSPLLYAKAIPSHFVDFWKRICDKKYQLRKLTENDPDWKCAFLQRFLKGYLESFNVLPIHPINMTPFVFFSQNPDEEFPELLRVVTTVAPFISCLRVDGFQCPFDTRLVLEKLTSLKTLHITYGRKHTGMDYKRQMIGIKMKDCENISEAVRYLPSLESLSLSGNQLDDDLLKIVLSGVSGSKSINSIDFSHNKIADEGARRVSKLIIKSPNVKKVNLCSNQIGYKGSRFLAQAVIQSKTLEHLDLSLNFINDNGGMKFFRDMINEQNSLKFLSLSGNLLKNDTCRKFAEYIKSPGATLEDVRLSSNSISDDSYAVLKEGLSRISELKFIDLRMNKLTEEHEKELRMIVAENRFQKENNKKPAQALDQKAKPDVPTLLNNQHQNHIALTSISTENPSDVRTLNSKNLFGKK